MRGASARALVLWLLLLCDAATRGRYRDPAVTADAAECPFAVVAGPASPASPVPMAAFSVPEHCQGSAGSETHAATVTPEEVGSHVVRALLHDAQAHLGHKQVRPRRPPGCHAALLHV